MVGTLHVGSSPVAVPTPAVTATIPLQLTLSQLPPEAIITYPGGNAAIDFLLSQKQLGPNPSISRLAAAFGDATISYRILGVTLLGGAGSDFTVDPGASIGATGPSATTGPLVFRPLSTGVRRDTVRVDVGSVQITGGSWAAELATAFAGLLLDLVLEACSIEVLGIGLSLKPNLSTLDFSAQPVGSAAPAAVDIQNVDVQALNTAATLTGEHAQDFSIVANPCAGASLAPTMICSIQVAFQPTARGVRTASLELASDGPGSPTVIPLIGVGTAPVASLSVESLAFEDTPEATASPPRLITVTNVGDAPLTVTGVTLVDDSTGSFAIVEETTTGPAIQMGQSRSIAVAFRPRSLGAVTASVLIASDGVGSPQRASLMGLGTPSADLAVAIAAPPTIQAGAQLTYTTTVRNAGPGTAIEVILSQELPSNATFVSVDQPSLAPPPGSTGTLDCRLGDLAAGQTAVLNTTVVIELDADPEVVGSAHVTSGTPDPFPRTKSATIVSRIVP
jgi:uncharacterized repeat protein (TIGR01451 family)